MYRSVAPVLFQERKNSFYVDFICTKALTNNLEHFFNIVLVEGKKVL